MINEERLPILDRVKKLLALAVNSNNEHEAALAAQRAAVLMERHEIHAAELRALDEAANIRTPEPIREERVAGGQKRVAWRLALARGITHKVHCHYFTNGGAIIFFGRLSTIQGAAYMLAYLAHEVERLAAREAPPRAGRAWHNAFKLGCAMRIAQRLNAKPVTARHVADEVSDDAVIASDGAPPPPSAGALVLIKKDREEVDAAYETRSATFSKGRAIGTAVSNYGAFERGRAAGDRANLGGDARGALKAGQGVLK